MHQLDIGTNFEDLTMKIKSGTKLPSCVFSYFSHNLRETVLSLIAKSVYFCKTFVFLEEANKNKAVSRHPAAGYGCFETK